MTNEKVILVDESDNVVGEMEKLEAHRAGKLHRAFSVFIFNRKKELLLQQRALTKYHSPGLWTNTCCSHPRPGEDTLSAAKRRLKEEMGIETKLDHVGEFIYKTSFDNGLTEHEFDHVFFGEYPDNPNINKDEANDFKWVKIEEVKKSLSSNPENYTYWFRVAVEKFL